MQNLLPRQKLKDFIKRYGTVSCEDIKRCESFLRDSCGGDYKREIFILVNAIREGVPKELLSPPVGLPLESVSTRLIQRLFENQGIDKRLAQWAVQSWGTALGVEIVLDDTPETEQIDTSSTTPPNISATHKKTKKPAIEQPTSLPESDNLLRTLTGHQDWILSIAYSPDGKTLASSSFDATVKLWEVATGQLLRTFKGPDKKPEDKKPEDKKPEDWVFAVTYSPKGRTLASASRDNTVKLWSIETGKELFTLKQGSGRWGKTEVYSVAYSPDGEVLAAANKDGIIKLWDAITGEKIRTLKGHEDWVLYVTYSPDGYTLASASRDNTIKLWDFKKGKLLRTLQESNRQKAERLKPNHAGPEHSVSLLAYSPDGNTLVSASYEQPIKIWDIDKGRELRTIKSHGTVYSIAYSPNGQTLASGHTEEMGSSIKLWEVDTGSLINTLYGHESRIESLAYSPDGQTLASASYDKTIKLWKM
jgi:WD40 repeat protein